MSCQLNLQDLLPNEAKERKEELKAQESLTTNEKGT